MICATPSTTFALQPQALAARVPANLWAHRDAGMGGKNETQRVTGRKME